MNPSELINVINKQDTEIQALKQELKNIFSMIRLNNDQKYGKSGDNVPYPEGMEQLNFFNEAEKYGRKDDPEPSFEPATSNLVLRQEKVQVKLGIYDSFMIMSHCTTRSYVPKRYNIISY